MTCREVPGATHDRRLLGQLAWPSVDPRGGGKVALEPVVVPAEAALAFESEFFQGSELFSEAVGARESEHVLGGDIEAVRRDPAVHGDPVDRHAEQG